DDLAITYHVMLGENNGTVVSAPVTNDLLKHYGISVEQLHEDALKSSEQVMQPTIHPMSDLLSSMTIYGGQGISQTEGFDAQLESISFDGPNMTVLSNKMTMFGAAAIAYDGMLDKIAEKAGTDLIVIPSSLHEVIILPDNGIFDYKDLENMVQEVNRYEVRPEDKLSDHLYHYDREGKMFEKAMDFKERMRSEVPFEKGRAAEVSAKKDGPGKERVSIKDQLKDATIESGKQAAKHLPKKEAVLS
ncbi:MAG: hypothetical protein IKF90_17060, partial [Parasporobacterium sp.]|nr:hypothetical protein [Parasporobacterium sp.]